MRISASSASASVTTIDPRATKRPSSESRKLHAQLTARRALVWALKTRRTNGTELSEKQSGRRGGVRDSRLGKQTLCRLSYSRREISESSAGDSSAQRYWGCKELTSVGVDPPSSCDSGPDRRRDASAPDCLPDPRHPMPRRREVGCRSWHLACARRPIALLRDLGEPRSGNVESSVPQDHGAVHRRLSRRRLAHTDLTPLEPPTSSPRSDVCRRSRRSTSAQLAFSANWWKASGPATSNRQSYRPTAPTSPTLPSVVRANTIRRQCRATFPRNGATGGQ